MTGKKIHGNHQVFSLPEELTPSENPCSERKTLALLH